MKNKKFLWRDYKFEINVFLFMLLIVGGLVYFFPDRATSLLDGTFLIGALAVPVTISRYMTSKRNEFYTESLSRLEDISQGTAVNSIQIRLLQLGNIYIQGDKNNTLFKEAVEEAYMNIIFTSITLEESENIEVLSEKLNKLDKRITKTPTELNDFKEKVGKLLSKNYNICWKNKVDSLIVYQQNTVFYSCSFEDFDKNIIDKLNIEDITDLESGKNIINSKITLSHVDYNLEEICERYSIEMNEETTINNEKYRLFYANIYSQSTTIKKEVQTDLKFRILKNIKSTALEIRNKYSKEGYVMITGESIEKKVRWFKISKENYKRNENADVYFFYKNKENDYSAVVIDNFNFTKIIDLKNENMDKYGEYAIDKNGSYHFYLRLDNDGKRLKDSRFKDGFFVELLLEEE